MTLMNALTEMIMDADSNDAKQFYRTVLTTLSEAPIMDVTKEELLEMLSDKTGELNINVPKELEYIFDTI